MQFRTIVEGLTFPEGPRWHDGRLWFSDFYTHRVYATDLDGNVEETVHVPEQPSGLGWLPDGRLLVVSMRDRKVLRLEGDSLVEHGDLAGIATFHANDMVVDRNGRAWVGNFGFDLDAGDTPAPTSLARVDPDGTVAVAAEDVFFPNGTVITPDGRTMILGETFAARLTAFDIGDDGELSNRRVWAELSPHVPDGICLDAEGAVWVADPLGKAVFRVREGGEVLDELSTGDQGAYACMLGGPDRRTLFVCSCDGTGPEMQAKKSGRILAVEVPVGGAGWPGDENA